MERCYLGCICDPPENINTGRTSHHQRWYFRLCQTYWINLSNTSWYQVTMGSKVCAWAISQWKHGAPFRRNMSLICLCSLADCYAGLFLIDKVTLILPRKDRSALASYLILIKQVPSVCCVQEEEGGEKSHMYYMLQPVTYSSTCKCASVNFVKYFTEPIPFAM